MNPYPTSKLRWDACRVTAFRSRYQSGAVVVHAINVELSRLRLPPLSGAETAEVRQACRACRLPFEDGMPVEDVQEQE